MMITGSWIANEMKGAGSTDDFDLMKTPVISSITDKLTTVKKESELRKVITAIDAVTDGEKDIAEYQDGENYKVDGLSVSAADWTYIRLARNSIASNYSGEGMFIPTYSNAKEGAKQFMYKMDEKGVVLNSAFSVSAAFVFGSHLAFTMAFDAEYVSAMMIGKLIAGVLAIFVANYVYERGANREENT